MRKTMKIEDVIAEFEILYGRIVLLKDVAEELMNDNKEMAKTETSESMRNIRNDSANRMEIRMACYNECLDLINSRIAMIKGE